MRNFIIRFVVLALVLCAFKANAQIAPWPWQVTAFPWSNIEGLWLAEDYDGVRTYFNFSVILTRSSKILKIEEVNPATRQVIAFGEGIEHDNIVNAKIFGSKRQYMYNVYISYYTNTEEERCQSLMILTKYSYYNDYVWTRQFRLTRITKKPIATEPYFFSFEWSQR